MTDINVANNGASFVDITANKAEIISEISYELRNLLADIMPGITEVNWANQQIAGYGVGEKKMSEHFCYIAPQTAHVNLGFNYGADLNDPEKLLEGSGKALRHIKFRTPEQVKSPETRKLILQASKHLPKLKK